MGRKKQKKILSKKNQRIIISIVIFILLILAKKTGFLFQIDTAIADTGIVNIVDTTRSDNSIASNYIATSVKTDQDIIEQTTSAINIEKDKLNLIYLNVGQADSELIIYNDKTMLIDAGNKADGEKIVSCIKALGITKLDYIIGTHVHEDHIGGMSYIIDSFDVGVFYLPYNTTSTTSYYKKLLISLTNKNLAITEANVGDKFNLGPSECEIMAVNNNEPENINDESIVLEIKYGNLKYLFMGDAQTSTEKLITWDDIDVLKVGHHGSKTSSSIDFLKQVLPEISIISAGKNNSYGLPKQETIDKLNSIGTKIYRTDEDGTIQIISDGNINEVLKIDVSYDGN